MTDELERLRAIWSSLGRDDPLWAVLSRADKRGGRWAPDEFFATGRAEIEAQLALLEKAGCAPRRGRALDFGCGVGRLTRALGEHFDEAIGVDVSPTMLARARELNADKSNLRFVENSSPRLEGIADASVDFVYSCMTLQHVPTVLAAGYVAEFARVLAPGGVADFQFVCATSRDWRGALHAAFPNRWLNPLRRLVWRSAAVFEMHVLTREAARAAIASHGAELVYETEDRAAGAGWEGTRWVVRKAPRPGLRRD